MASDRGAFGRVLLRAASALVILLPFSGVSSALAAGTFYVDGANASCSNSGPGTAAVPYCTISAAASAQHGGGTTILVKPAVYREEVTVPASGGSGNPFVFQALGSPVVVDGADDFGSASKWRLYSGNVYLAAGVTWSPKQVFADGARVTPSGATPASLPPGTFRYVSSAGLYVNVGGGNPGDHQALVGRRTHGFSFNGRSYVTITGFTITRTEDNGVDLKSSSNNATISNCVVSFTNSRGIYVSGSSNVVIASNVISFNNDHGIYLTSSSNGCTVQDNESFGNARPSTRAANGLNVSGSTGNLIQRNRFHDNQDSGMMFQSSGNNNISLQNLSWNNGDHGYDHLNSSGNLNVGNVAWHNYKDGISIEGTSPSNKVFNCILVDNGLTTNEFDLWVDSTSKTGFVSDDNIIWNSITNTTNPIKYVSTQYATIAAFTAASGQDRHSIQANPRFVDPASGNFHLLADSPAIDSADSSVSNWPATDAEGNVRFDDPATPNTGAGPVPFADRGALEFIPNNLPPNAAPNGIIDTPAGSVTVNAGQAVSFTGTGTDPDNTLPLTYLWSFGGGAPNQTAQDPGAVVFNTPGAYTVSFTVTDALGLADPTPDTRVIIVNAPPDSVIQSPSGSVTITAGQSVNFTGAGTDPDNTLPLTYLWNFGGGAPNQAVQNPGATVFSTPGIYTVTFTVTDALGLSDPTPGTRIITVNANQAPNGVIQSPAGHVTVPLGQSVSFTGAGTDPDNTLPLTYLWSFGGGAPDQPVQNPGAVVFNTPGIYTVTFTVTDALGLADPTPDTRLVTVNAPPDGTISSPAGPATIIAGASVDFTGTGSDPDGNLPLTFLWNFGGGAANRTAQDPGAVVFSTPGTYTVTLTVTDALGLSDPTPDTRIITVNPNQAPDGVISTPAGPVTINERQRVNFTGTGTDPDNTLPLTYLWNFGGGAPNQTVQNPGDVVFSTPGTFTVTFTVSDALGLSDPTPDTRVITVNAPPDSIIQSPAGPVAITAGQSLDFSGAGADPDNTQPLSYLWDFGGGASSQTAQNPGKVLFDTPGTYTVTFTVTDALGLSDPTPDTRVITVNANEAPDGAIDTPAHDVTILVGQSVSFAGTGTDTDNTLPLTFSWDFSGGAVSQTVEDPGAVTFNVAGTYAVSFTVTDALGLADPTPDTRVVNVLASLANDEIHWSFIDPTSVTIDWRGPDSTVEYGPTDAYGQTATGITPDPVPISSAGPFWEARITGLQPGTVYHYAVGNGLDHTFRTPPLPGTTAAFTVFVEGDIGQSVDEPAAGTAQSQVAAGAPAFSLLVGDLTYADLHGQAAVDQHFNDVMVWSQDAAYMPAWGTHEWSDPANDDLRNYKGRFDPPNPQTSLGAPDEGCCGKDWYWFDYGNVRFISYPEPYVEPDTWADWNAGATALMDAAQIDPAIRYIVTFGHRPAYSSGHQPGVDSLRGYLDALGAGHGKYVLNLNGDSHDYERTSPQNGVIHVTVGTGGFGLDQDGSCLWLTCEKPSWSAFRAMHLGSLRLNFTGTAIEGAFICGPAGSGINDVSCAEGSVLDSFTIPATPPDSVIDTPAGPVTIREGQSVSFTGTGTDPDLYLPLSFSWDFDGGATNRTDEDPGPVVFSAPGTYTVSFAATNNLGHADPTPDTRVITVNPNQPPDGTIDTPAGATLIQPGQSVNFTGTGTDPEGDLPLTFSWDFGGGAPAQNVQNPGHVVFNTAGTYTVTFTVTDALGKADPTPATRVISVNPNQPPNGVIQSPAGSVTITAGQSVDFTGAGTDPDNTLPLSYLWDFGGGAPNQAAQSPGATVFSTPGIYTVTFTVTDAGGLSDTTPDTRVITVNANHAPDGVIQSPAGAVTIVAGQSVSFAGTGSDQDNTLPLSFHWDFAGGAANQTVQDPGAIIFSIPGIYTVSFTVTDALGLSDPTPDTRVITVNANQAPNGTIDTPAGPVTIASGQSVSFSGTGTDPDGTLPLAFHWRFTGGLPDQTAEDPGAVVFNVPGTYTVTFTVTDALGLPDPTPDSRVITVTNRPPTAVLGVTPATGNEPLSVTADASASGDPDGTISAYLFDFGDGTVVGPQASPTATHLYAAGNWTARVSVTDNLGATGSATVPVIVAPVGSGPNLIGNPSFETNTTGWSNYGGATSLRVTGGFDGTYALQINGPATLATFGMNDSPNWVLTTPAAGTRYRYNAWIRSASSTGRLRLKLREYLSGTQVGSTVYSSYVMLSPTWQMLTVDIVTQATGSTIDLQVLDDAPAAPGEVFLLDNVSAHIVP